MIYGHDVSNFQKNYAWPGGLKFGFAKATEGLTFNDAYFAHNWSALKTKGYVRGAYHFAHTNNGAEAEAKHFLTVVLARGLADGDLLALDIETTDGQKAAHIASWCKTWLTYVEKQTGIRPLVYTYRDFAAHNCAGLGGYPLWIADPTNAGKPRLAGPWKDWAIHQYSTAGGIDHDCTRLTVAQLRELGGDDVSAKDVWSFEIPKTADFPDEWQAGTHLRHTTVMLGKIAAGQAALAKNAGVDIDEKAVAQAIVAALDVDTLAELIKTGLAADVVDELKSRL